MAVGNTATLEREAGSRMVRGFYEILILLHSQQNIPYFKKGSRYLKRIAIRMRLTHTQSQNGRKDKRIGEGKKMGENNNI